MIVDSGKVKEREFALYDLNMNEWNKPKPFGLSVCMRVRNEAEMMPLAVKSFEPYADEIVLVVQPSEDNTEDLAHELSHWNSKIRVVRYPFKPYPIASQEHFNEPVNSVRHFVHMSNWALTQCRYSWIAKVEGDVVALPSFERARDWIETNPDSVAYLGLVLLNLAGPDRDQFSATFPRNHGWDEAVFNNIPEWHFVRNDKWESVNHWEHGPNINLGWTLYHLKRCKSHYRVLPHEQVDVHLPLDRENLTAALQNFNRFHPYPGPDDPLGPDFLLSSLPLAKESA